MDETVCQFKLKNAGGKLIVKNFDAGAGDQLEIRLKGDPTTVFTAYTGTNGPDGVDIAEDTRLIWRTDGGGAPGTGVTICIE